MPWSPPAAYLRYDIEHVERRATVRLAGELDLASRAIAHRALAEAISGCVETVVDLSRVTFVDAQGARLLLTAQQDARAAGNRLIFRRPHRAVRRMLEVSGMLPLLELDGASTGRALLSLSRDVGAICKRAIDSAMRIDRTDKANIQLFDPSTHGLRIAAQHGFNRDFLDFFEIVDDDDSACGSALKNGCSVWVPDTAASPIFAGTPALDVMLDAGSRAVASVPVVSPNWRLIAMISTHHDRRPAWTDDRRQELERLACWTGRLLHQLMPNPRQVERPPL